MAGLSLAMLVVGRVVSPALDWDYRVYVTSSERSVERVTTSVETWNAERSPRVFYMFGKSANPETITRTLDSARVPAAQVVFLNADDNRVDKKDLHIWQYAWDTHGRGNATVKWFTRVDDDTYLVLPRLHGLLHALHCEGEEPFVGGMPFWLAAAPFRNPLDPRGRLSWVGNRLFAGQRLLVHRAFDAERKAKRPPLVFCAGGPGILVSRAAMESTAGFSEPCLRAIHNIEAAGCLSFVGKGADWAAHKDVVKDLGRGEVGSYLHRIACLPQALGRGRGPPQSALNAGHLRLYSDAILSYCFEHEHNRRLSCQLIACAPSAKRGSDLLNWPLHQGGAKQFKAGRKTRFPPHLVGVHGVRDRAIHMRVHKSYVEARGPPAAELKWPQGMAGGIVVVAPPSVNGTRGADADLRQSQPKRDACAATLPNAAQRYYLA